ncbi:glycosyl hydrolases family 31-domain-containing protein [Aspergillus californicus]
MEFKIEPATAEDAPRLTEIYFSAFTDDFSLRLLPPTEDGRVFMTESFTADIAKAQSSQSTIFQKIVGSGHDQSPVIAGFALWRFFDIDSASDGHESEIPWPPSSDSELCARFFGGAHEERKRAIGEQSHYYLDILAVHPEFGRRGLGGQLLKSGLDRADEARLITFISASPAGKGLEMEKYEFPTRPKATDGAVVQGPTYRFTLLSDRLIRFEWAEDGEFEDRASTFAINRDFTVPEFRSFDSDELEIVTDHFHLSYTKQKFSPESLIFYFNGKSVKYGTPWRFGTPTEFNLGGTARTLDGVDGRCDMGDGVLSKAGYAVIDDSKSMLFDGKGFVAARKPGERYDCYLFAYGRDYKAAIKALYAVSGEQPAIPRFSLGNWWSRYYAYHQDEYVALMDKFQTEGIPLSVAVLDMDWHLVSDPKVPHAGWTGYTWDRNNFPDPIRFRQEIHERKLQITLNDHPHSGVHSHEDSYVEMAQFLGHDPSEKKAILFDPTSPKFMEAYLGILHRKLEEEACDFWWVDWQQGPYSKIPGFDPLWLLNHFQYLDSGRDGRTPLIFSRYGGPGSHRYPIGFSGDTVVSWASLAFQPEFTATASNIGYGWWSHDIGGHIRGIRDDELLVRWTQLGVFSPVMRLHSTSSRWMSKEPWLYSDECNRAMTKFLQFRHKLVPYLYSQSVLGSRNSEPLIQPMYWSYPHNNEAYEVPNQYFLGTDLLIAPIVQARDKRTNLASVKAWLPPRGRFIDIFTGTVYSGGRGVTLYRPLDQYPVLAAEGSIIPTDTAAAPSNGCGNPGGLDILIVVGQDGSASVVEERSDDRPSASGAGHTSGREPRLRQANISFRQKHGKLTAQLFRRNWRFRFLGVTSTLRDLTITIGGLSIEQGYLRVTRQEPPGLPSLTVEIPESDLGHGDELATVTITLVTFERELQLDVMDHEEVLERLIRGYQIEHQMKDQLWSAIETAGGRPGDIVSSLLALGYDQALVGPLIELVLADNRRESENGGANGTPSPLMAHPLYFKA